MLSITYVPDSSVKWAPSNISEYQADSVRWVILTPCIDGVMIMSLCEQLVVSVEIYMPTVCSLSLINWEFLI